MAEKSLIIRRKIINKSLAMIKKKDKGKNIIYILSLTIVTIVIWIAVDAYNAYSQKIVSGLSLEEIHITDPNIDISTLESLQTRESPSQAQLSQLPDTKITIEPEIESEKEASPASQIQP